MKEFIQDMAVLILIVFACGILGHALTDWLGWNFQFGAGFIAAIFYYKIYNPKE